MEKLQELKACKDKMKMRKVLFGGYDRQDVQDKIDVLYSLAEKNIKEQYEMEQALLATVEEQKRSFQEQTEALKKDFENQQKASEFLMIELNKNISELTEENETLVLKQGKMREAYKEYCETILKQYSESLCALSGEFTKILDNVANLQKEIGSKDILREMDRALEMKQVYEALEEVEK